MNLAAADVPPFRRKGTIRCRPPRRRIAFSLLDNERNEDMSATDSRGGDLSSLESDIAALKRDVASLIGHLKVGVTGSAQAAADQIGGGSARLYDLAIEESSNAAKVVAGRVGEQPLLCLAIALGLGFVGGRLLVR
jgi:hypothetical protein